MSGNDRPDARTAKPDAENDATPASDRRRAASRRNLEKAWAASRANWEKTPARMAHSRESIQLAHAAIRKRPRQLSPAQLDAARRNVANARAAMARRGRTPEHLAKLRETLKLARAARTRSSFDLHNAKLLRHGVFVRSVRATMRALGDNPGRLDQRIRLLKRFFASDNPREEAFLRAIAEMFWRRERLYYAHAEWECRKLDRVLMLSEPAPEGYTFTSDEMINRAYRLLDALLDFDRLNTREWHMTGSLKRLLRRLLRLRLGREPDFHP
ncbi:MAG TPA: hypothetical protein VFM21_01680 [Terriglobia bacterium]|nr:hypothetical protein [Terriglobia bacterium]